MHNLRYKTVGVSTELGWMNSPNLCKGLFGWPDLAELRAISSTLVLARIAVTVYSQALVAAFRFGD